MVNTLLVAFLEVYGEPQVERAITFETQIDETKAAAEKAKGMDMADGQQELVSRSVQAGIGLFVAVVYILHCLWWTVRIGVRLRLWAHGRDTYTTSSVSALGCDRLRRNLFYAQFEIPSKSAIGRGP